jgi:uncharacterized membrane protein YcaP (DUF421 family)
MDPLRIATRAAFTFVVVLILIRLSGKRAIRHGDLSSFIVGVMVGDLFDDFFWADVAAAQFLVAVGTVMMTHMLIRTGSMTSGMRDWRRGATPSAHAESHR